MTRMYYGKQEFGNRSEPDESFQERGREILAWFRARPETYRGESSSSRSRRCHLSETPAFVPMLSPDA